MIISMNDCVIAINLIVNLHLFTIRVINTWDSVFVDINCLDGRDISAAEDFNSG